MKIRHILVLGAVMAVSPIAHAELPLDAAKLGHMKGVLDVCGSAVPRKASDYLLQMKSMLGKATKAEVNEAAKSEEYREAYQSVRSRLSGLTRDELTTECTAYLATTN